MSQKQIPQSSSEGEEDIRDDIEDLFDQLRQSIQKGGFFKEIKSIKRDRFNVKQFTYTIEMPPMNKITFKTFEKYLNHFFENCIKQLYFPVLPTRINGKLVFTLCQTCAEEENQEAGIHENDKRMLCGEWVSHELQKAVEKGYEIIKIHEVWHWDETTVYDRETRQGGLFAYYINRFLKLKQEASGWPSEDMSEEDKDEYISEFEEAEGIELDKDNIQTNECLRSVAKLLLNSHWGRYALNSNKTKHKLCKNSHEFYELLLNNENLIQSIDCSRDNVIQVYYSTPKEMHTGCNTTNVAIAAFVTAHARLKLYSELEQIGERALYCDTDSIFLVENVNDTIQYKPECGNNLGDFTDEISKLKNNQEFVKEETEKNCA